MSTKDFQAKQIRSSRWIASGSSSSQPSLMIYSASAASNYVGGVATDLLTKVGTDVFVFFSGSKSEPSGAGSAGWPTTRSNITLFGGDVVVSGTLFAEHSVIEVDGNVTGSMLISGSLFVSQSATIKQDIKINASNASIGYANFGATSGAGGYGFRANAGSIQFKNSGGAWTSVGSSGPGAGWIAAANEIISTTGSVYIGTANASNPDINLGKDGSAVFNEQSNSVDFRIESNNKSHAFFVDGSTDQILILSGGSGQSVDEAAFSDVSFYVSGTIGSQGTTDRGTSLFGGDAVISGSLKVSSPGVGSDVIFYGQDANAVGLHWDASGFEHGRLNLGAADHGVDLVVYGETSGRYLHWNQDEDTLNVLGVLSQKLGNATFNENAGAYDFRVEGLSKNNALLVSGSTNQVLILSGGSGQSYNEAAGGDVAFYVSGTSGGKGSPTHRGVSVFGGDNVISGALHVGNPSFPFTKMPQIQLDGVSGYSRIGTKDGNTYIQFNDSTEASSGLNAGEISLNSDGLPGLFMTRRGAVFNEAGGLWDFRVETDSKTHAIFTSGSTNQVLILSGGSVNSFNEAGAADVAFYVSGAIDSRGTSVRGTSIFGGDTAFSGSAHYLLGLSGSLTRILDGSSYIKAGSGILVTSASNGSVTIASSGGGGSVTSGSFNVPNPSEFVTTASVSLAGRNGFEYPADSIGSDVYFFTSGSVNGKGSPAAVSVFGGDLLVSGVHYIGQGGGLRLINGTNDTSEYFSITKVSAAAPSQAKSVIAQNRAGSIILGVGTGSLAEASDFFCVTEMAASIGASVKTYMKTSGSFGGQVLILSGGGSKLSPNEGKFTDVSFFVSGSTNSRGSTSGGVALFGGDVVISGTVYGGSPLKISTDAHLVAANGATQYLYFGASAAGTGYGLRSNAGTLQFKNNGGTWANLGSGGGGSGSGITVSSGSTSTGSVTTLNLDMLGSLLDLGGGTVAVTGTIGAAEDGTYSEGLFTSFSTSTPIGTAIDKINEVLKYLSPSPSPDLDDINSLKVGVTSLLAFGASNSVGGYTAVGASAGVGAAVDVGGSYALLTSSNNIRLATFNGAASMTGTLNADVAADVYAGGLINYSGSTFGDAETGTLSLVVNGTTLKSVNLSLANAGIGSPGAGTGNQLINLTGSGFYKLSQTGSGVQSNGQSFGLFLNRTGRFAVAPVDQREGWNYARVTHTVGSKVNTTNYVEWVNDGSSNALQVHDARFATGSTESINLSGSVSISGVKYATSSGGTYKATINNFYNNVYALNTITFSNTRCTIANQAVPNVAGSGANTKIIALTGSFATSGASLLGTTLASNISVAHPLKTAISNSGSITSLRYLIFSASNTSTALVETFNRENYRLMSGSYPTQSSTGSATWDSTIHMSASTGYSDGLQFYDGELKSPLSTLNGGDFRSKAQGGTYFGAGLSYNNNPNYSTISENPRTFYRSFVNSTGAPARDFDITITGGGSTIVPGGTSIVGQTGKIRVHAKIPGKTGMLDLGTAFTFMTASSYAGGRIGSLDATVDGGGAVNHFSFGSLTIPDDHHVIVKIEADKAWTGNLEDITVNFPAVGVTAVTEAPAVSNASCSDTGVDAKLSFGSSHAVGSYTNVGTSAGLSAVDCNGLYEVSSNSGNLRRGIFAGATVINGVVNDATTANGNSYIANSFGGALTGTLALEVNGSSVISRDLYDFTLGTGGNTTIVNGNGTGFTDVSEPTVGRDTDSLPDYRRWYRTANWTVAAADQRDGWNYAKVTHTILGSAVATNFIEWVNDDDSNSMTIDSTEYDSYFGDDAFYYQSGVKYFTSPTSSMRYRVTHGYSNIYSNNASALSLTSLTNLTTTRMAASGSGITDAGANSTGLAMPALLTAVADSQTRPIFVTGNVSFSQSKSLPGTWGTTGYGISAVATAIHPLNGTINSSAVTKSNFLVFSASLSDGSTTSNINTTEVFEREDFRILSGNFANQSATGSAGWNSQTSMETGGVGYNTGMLIYNSRACSPSGSNLPNHGNFKDTVESGTLTSASGNVDYTSLTKTIRDYYRPFVNNTTSDQASVSITLYGDATLVPKTGAGADTIGANKKFHLDVKIPGKTGWMDSAKAASGGISNMDGALAGDRDPTVDGAGATNVADFQTQFVAGTVSAGGPEHFVVRIIASKAWTGYISKIVVTY